MPLGIIRGLAVTARADGEPVTMPVRSGGAAWPQFNKAGDLRLATAEKVADAVGFGLRTCAEGESDGQGSQAPRARRRVTIHYRSLTRLNTQTVAFVPG
jgi:hypothetical protein